MDQIVKETVLWIIGLLVLVYFAWTISYRVYFSRFGHSSTATNAVATTTGTTSAKKWEWWEKQQESWKKAPITMLLWTVFWLWVLGVAGPWVIPLVWQIPQWSIQTAYSTPQAPPSKIQFSTQKMPRNENEDRNEFFVETPRKLGWKVMPTRVDFNVPLDGKERYLGLNIDMFKGARLQIDCPGYWSGNDVALYAKGDDKDWYHLAHSNTITVRDTGTVNGKGALLVRGVRKAFPKNGDSNVIIAEVSPRPGHVRIATTKVCETRNADGTERRGEPWGIVQLGKATGSPHWEVYVRFADAEGLTIHPDVMQQKPGRIMLGVPEEDAQGKKTFRSMVSEVVSKPANVYGKYSVPEDEEDPFLLIQPPNVPDGVVTIEVILDIDYTRK